MKPVAMKGEKLGKAMDDSRELSDLGNAEIFHEDKKRVLFG
jgi:hypothetical protein